MLPTPTMSTETLASCADAVQTDAPRTIDANRDGLIIHQVMLAPLARTPKVGCRVSPAIGLVTGMPLPTMPARSRHIEGSINVDSLQHHHELGCRVTNADGVSSFRCSTCRRDGWRLLSKLIHHQPLHRSDSAGDLGQGAYDFTPQLAAKPPPSPARSPTAPHWPWRRRARRPAPCRAGRRRPCRRAPRSPCAPAPPR